MSHKVYTNRDFRDQKFDFQPGDFILGHKEDLHDKFIHLITRSKWNHAALIIDTKGTVVEMTQKGIQKSQVKREQEEEIYLVRMKDLNREKVVDYAQKALKDKPKFSHLGLLSIIFHQLFKSPIVIKHTNKMVCSEFVINALSHGGVIWEKEPTLITPADLYKKFVGQ